MYNKSNISHIGESITGIELDNIAYTAPTPDIPKAIRKIDIKSDEWKQLKTSLNEMAVHAKTTDNKAEADKYHNDLLEEGVNYVYTLTHYYSKGFKFSSVDFEDIFQNMYEKFLKICANYDPEIGTPFSTYADSALRFAYNGILRTPGNGVAVSDYFYRNVIKVKRALNDLNIDYNAPNQAKLITLLSQKTGLSEDAVSKAGDYLNKYASIMSLDESTNNTEDKKEIDCVDENAEDFYAEYDSCDELAGILNRVLSIENGLTARQIEDAKDVLHIPDEFTAEEFMAEPGLFWRRTNTKVAEYRGVSEAIVRKNVKKILNILRNNPEIIELAKCYGYIT